MEIAMQEHALRLARGQVSAEGDGLRGQPGIVSATGRNPRDHIAPITHNLRQGNEGSLCTQLAPQPGQEIGGYGVSLVFA
jgi:hypothetical protein